jgi:hypothetical protein
MYATQQDAPHRNKDIKELLNLYPILAGAATGYGWTTERSEFDSLYDQEFFLFHIVQTGLEPTQTPLQWLLVVLSLGVKWQGREADHSPPTSAEVKKRWFYTSTPAYAFMACWLIS